MKSIGKTQHEFKAHTSAKSGFKPFYNAAWWDDVFHGPNRQKIFFSILELDPNNHTEHADIIRYRQAHIHANLAATHDGLEGYQTALRLLKAVSTIPKSGLELMCVVGLMQFKEARVSGYVNEGGEPLALENSMYGEYALSVANLELGHHEDAYHHLNVVEFLAKTLNLSGRMRRIELQKLNLLNILGRPNSSAVEQLLPTIHNASAKVFAFEVLAESLLAEGRYLEALKAGEALGDPGYTALLNLLAGNNAEPLQIARSPYQEIAVVLKALLDGKSIPIARKGLKSYNEGYSDILDRLENLFLALTQYREEKYHLAIHTLGDYPFMQPDLAILWHLLRLGLTLHTNEPSGFNHLDEINNSVEKLKELGHIINLATRLTKDEVRLIGFVPAAIPAFTEAVSDLPLLLGKNLNYGDQKIKVYSYGMALVKDALTDSDYYISSKYRSDHKRYRKKLLEADVELENVVNAGGLWRSYLKLEKLAQLSDDLHQAAQWRRGRESLENSSKDLVIAIMTTQS